MHMWVMHSISADVAYNFIIRNPSMQLLQKKSRQRTVRKKYSDFSSAPNEHGASEMMLEYVLLFASASIFSKL